MRFACPAEEVRRKMAWFGSQVHGLGGDVAAVDGGHHLEVALRLHARGAPDELQVYAGLETMPLSARMALAV